MLDGCQAEMTRFSVTTSACAVWEMSFSTTRDSLNSVWQADITAVMNFLFHKISHDLLPTVCTVSFSLTASIHAAINKLSTTLLINRYQSNVEFKFKSARIIIINFL